MFYGCGLDSVCSIESLGISAKSHLLQKANASLNVAPGCKHRAKSKLESLEMPLRV